MNIDYPTPDQIQGLQHLWQEAFGDDEVFLEQFYTFGFSPDRCRCVTVDGQLAAALYWFDCEYRGNAGVILVPAEETLFQMYEKMGYCACASVAEFVCTAGLAATEMRAVDVEEYRRLRRQFLPEKGVVQEGNNLTFLQTMADFYAGADFVVAVARSEKFFAPELLGNAQAAPGILAALRKKQGKFRGPGEGKPFAMYHALQSGDPPEYFGLAFD